MPHTNACLPRRRSNSTFARKLSIERLEDRRLLAAYLVNTELDSLDASDGLTSLREAIVSSNAALGPDTINFDVSLAGKTILLIHGELSITDSLTINGLGADQLTIDASGNDPTPTQKNQDGTRVFNIDGPGEDYLNVVIRGLTITGGDSPGEHNAAYIRQGGGGIRNREDLTLTDCRITNNWGYQGGAIATEGPLQVVSCLISGNTSYFLSGGGIQAAYDTPVSIVNSNISGNTSYLAGGGISQDIGREWGWITIVNSSITHNVAHSSGGGIQADVLIVDSSDISDNTSARYGGGIDCSLLTITSSQVNNNSALDGGGILCDSNPSSITNCVIRENSAQEFGGGIHSGDYDTGGSMTIRDTIVDGNTARWAGGGIYEKGGLTLERCSIRGNSAVSVSDCAGGGILSRNFLHLLDSVVSDNATSGKGGGICAEVDGLQLTNCIVNNNTAGREGGGIYAVYPIYEPSSILRNSTVIDNMATSGGGVYMSRGVMPINDSIVARNFASPGAGNDIIGLFTAKFSLIGDATGATTTDNGGNLFGNSSMPIDPLLSPPGYYGGPAFLDGSHVLTYSLILGSPALNAGNPNATPGVNGLPTNDQRGAAFNRVYGGRLDMGAIESQPNPLPGDYNFNATNDAADYVLWRKTLGSTTDLRANGDNTGTSAGVIDAADYSVWRNNFGKAIPAAGNSVASAASVEDTVTLPNETAKPEPVFAESTSRTTPSFRPPQRQALCEAAFHNLDLLLAIPGHVPNQSLVHSPAETISAITRGNASNENVLDLAFADTSFHRLPTFAGRGRKFHQFRKLS